MKIKSLGLKTDLMFYKNDAQLDFKDDYILVHTVHNHDYYWGNLLIFNQGPKSEDVEKWQEFFNSEFGKYEDINHMTFCWDISENDDPTVISKFEELGFEFDETTVLAAKEINAKFKNSKIIIKKVQTDDEWKELIEFQKIVIELDNEEFELEHTIKRFNDYRVMSEKGLGSWYVAKVEDIIVCDLGLYMTDSIARFQDIKTHPDFRKKGIAQTLMDHASKDNDFKQIVIQAQEDGPAFKMYISMGFEVIEKIKGLCKYES